MSESFVFRVFLVFMSCLFSLTAFNLYLNGKANVFPRVPSETLSTPCANVEACGPSASQCSFLFLNFAPTSWGAGLTQKPAPLIYR